MNNEVKVYTLKYPVTLGQYTCTEVKLCRPKTKDFLAVGTQTIDTPGAMVSLISSISGVPESVVNLFDIDDISHLRIEAQRIFCSYLERRDYEVNPTPAPAPAPAPVNEPEPSV